MISKLRLASWGAARLLVHGKPDVALGFLGGIGDDLLCSVAVDEWLKRGAKRVWFITRFPDLYTHYDRRVRRIPEDQRYVKLLDRLNIKTRYLSYSKYDSVTDRETPPSEHIIASMCRASGLTGEIQLRPTLPRASLEKPPQVANIVVQSSIFAAAVPMGNKQWRPERMQEVVTHFVAKGYTLAQIGSASDSPLVGALDLRGKTSLRQSAAVLASARLFVGPVGFAMHLARSVDCPSVAIYGGRETASLTGYSCNINLERTPACSPCWQRNRCDFEHVCMESISSDDVIEAVSKVLAMPPAPLKVSSVVL